MRKKIFWSSSIAVLSVSLSPLWANSARSAQKPFAPTRIHLNAINPTPGQEGIAARNVVIGNPDIPSGDKSQEDLTAFPPPETARGFTATAFNAGSNDPIGPITEKIKADLQDARENLSSGNALAASGDIAGIFGDEQAFAADIPAKPQEPESPDVWTLENLTNGTPGVITADKARRLMRDYHLSVEQLLLKLTPIAKGLAQPPVSRYYVGAAGMGESGNVYLGFNYEFKDFPREETIHAEQALVNNARSHGEKKLLYLAVSASACGHCRQFLSELGMDDASGRNHLLKIITPGPDDREFEARTLAELLPDPFTSLPRKMLESSDHRLALTDSPLDGVSPDLAQAALAAANASYAVPGSAAGAAIQTRDGGIYKGYYLQVSGANPSLSALRSALLNLAADRKTCPRCRSWPERGPRPY